MSSEQKQEPEPEPEQFVELHRREDGTPSGASRAKRTRPDGWEVWQEFATIHELFDWAPDAAEWFERHPHATYFQHDHGQELHWRYERVNPGAQWRQKQ